MNPDEFDVEKKPRPSHRPDSIEEDEITVRNRFMGQLRRKELPDREDLILLIKFALNSRKLDLPGSDFASGRHDYGGAYCAQARAYAVLRRLASLGITAEEELEQVGELLELLDDLITRLKRGEVAETPG